MPTILIADDNDANRVVLSKLLGRAGYTTIEAPDGASAIEQVRTERPDMALVDLLMPVVDGFEFVYRLRQEPGPHARTPVVFMTAAYIPSEVLPLARHCGVSRVLTRPATLEEILDMVRETLEAGPQETTETSQLEFRLELLRVITGTLSQKVRTVIPSLAEYFASEGWGGAEHEEEDGMRAV